MCKVAPSQIADSQLGFKFLCGQIDWEVLPHCIPMKAIPKRDTSPVLNGMVDWMMRFLRESACEQALWLPVYYWRWLICIKIWPLWV